MDLVQWDVPKKRRNGSSYYEQSGVHATEDRKNTVCGTDITTKRNPSIFRTITWAAVVTCYNCAYRLALQGKWPLDRVPGKNGTTHPAPVAQ